MEQMKKISSADLGDAITINHDPLGKISVLGPVGLQTFLHHVSQVCDHLGSGEKLHFKKTRDADKPPFSTLGCAYSPDTG
jgi:hypothetical protein